MGTPRIPIERSSPAATKVASISQGIAGYLLSLFATLARAYLDFRRKRRQESPFKRLRRASLPHLEMQAVLAGGARIAHRPQERLVWGEKSVRHVTKGMFNLLCSL